MNNGPTQNSPEGQISNRENLLNKRRLNSETGTGEVDFNSYSKETLNNKSALEKNPACIISIEKNTGNTMVRNQEIVRDADGNETRYYIYNIVNQDQIFSAKVSEFVPGKYLADEVDREISVFLKKGINKPEQIENISDARVALLAGVIDRLDYLAIEQRIKSPQKNQGTAENITTNTTPSIPENTQQTINTAKSTTEVEGKTAPEKEQKLSPDLMTEALIIELTQKYFPEKATSLKKSNENILEDLNKIDLCVKDLEMMIINTPDKNIRDLLQQKVEKLKNLKEKILINNK